MTEMEARLIERARNLQAEFLKSYFPAQELGQLRDDSLEARAAAMESRIAYLEQRLWEIETRRLINRPAA